MNIGVVEINALAYLGVLMYYIYKKRQIDLGLILLTIYTICSLSAVKMVHHFMFQYSVHDNKELIMAPFVYLFILLMFCFYPVLKYDQKQTRVLNEESEAKFRNLSLFLFGISVLSVLFALPAAVEGMSGDIALNREDAMNEGVSTSTVWGVSQVQNLARYLMNFSLVMFFYSLCVPKLRKYSIFLIIPSFVSPLVTSLAYSARGGVVFLILNSVFVFFLLKNYLPAKIKYFIVIFSSVFIGLFMIIFMVISFARFGDSDEGVEYFMFKYAGESFVNFNGILWQDLRELLNGDTCFPGIRKLLGLEYRVSLSDFRASGERITGIPIYIYYTFIGDLICDFGKWIAAILVIGFGFIVRKFFKNKDTIELRDVMVKALLLSVMGEGILIFSYQASNLTFILTALLYFYLKPEQNEEALK